MAQGEWYPCWLHKYFASMDALLHPHNSLQVRSPSLVTPTLQLIMMTASMWLPTYKNCHLAFTVSGSYEFYNTLSYHQSWLTGEPPLSFLSMFVLLSQVHSLWPSHGTQSADRSSSLTYHIHFSMPSIVSHSISFFTIFQESSDK